MTTLAHDLARSRGFLLEADVDLIQEGVRTLPHSRFVTVVDLGAGSGTTALSVFCERPIAIIVVTVDHDEVAIASTRELLTNARHVQHWVGVLSKTTEATLPPEVPMRPFDMLMVDADHSYEGVKADLETWLPSVRDGAPVWLHDYTEEYPGSMRAIDEAIAEGKLEFVKTQGWGILCRKAAQS